MASWAPAASAESVDAPARPRTRAKARPHVAGSVLWIALAGLLLAGVVFLNVVVLRLNLQLDGLGRERTRLRAENAALASQVSGAANSLKIEAQARKELGLQPADPDQISYLDLSH
jgi:cell division protein FtsL